MDNEAVSECDSCDDLREEKPKQIPMNISGRKVPYAFK